MPFAFIRGVSRTATNDNEARRAFRVLHETNVSFSYLSILAIDLERSALYPTRNQMGISFRVTFHAIKGTNISASDLIYMI